MSTRLFACGQSKSASLVSCNTFWVRKGGWKPQRLCNLAGCQTTQLTQHTDLLQRKLCRSEYLRICICHVERAVLADKAHQ